MDLIVFLLALLLVTLVAAAALPLVSYLQARTRYQAAIANYKHFEYRFSCDLVDAEYPDTKTEIVTAPTGKPVGLRGEALCRDF